MPNLQLVSNEFIGDFTGATQVTCKEAANLLNKGKVRKALFRPSNLITYSDPDNDPAFVWWDESVQ